jgi:hypothetical protein
MIAMQQAALEAPKIGRRVARRFSDGDSTLTY